jgi:DNA-binding LytR/AlgR family response regulator
MAEDLGAYVRETLRDAGVARALESSPKLRRLLKRLLDEIRRLMGISEEDDGSVFPIKNGAETQLIRACDIFFFEAQGRKIALRTQSQELTFYASFEHLTDQLPSWFLRCHRGYIVNAKKLRSASLAENTLMLSDGSAVPVSRTYRDAVRAALENKKGGDQS